MREAFEFDDVDLLTAGARGVPGKRTFYIMVGQGERLLRVWVEKGQLQALAEAIDQLIEGLPARARPRAPREAPEPSETSAAEPREFRAQSLALGYDREQRRAGLFVNEHLEDDAPEEAPSLQVWSALGQLQGLSKRIVTVCASGRQPCPLCGLPIAPEGHVCPRTNGHHPALRFT